MKMATTRGPVIRRPRKLKITREGQWLRPIQRSRRWQCKYIHQTRWPSGWQRTICINDRIRESFCIWYVKEKFEKFLDWWRSKQDWRRWSGEANDLRRTAYRCKEQRRSENSGKFTTNDWLYLIYCGPWSWPSKHRTEYLWTKKIYQLKDKRPSIINRMCECTSNL